MSNHELGTKRVCADCGAKFYDLNKNPMVCPKCGHEEAVPVTRAKRKAAEAPVVVPEPKKAKVEEKIAEEGDLVVGAETSLEELAEKERAADSDDDVDEDLLPGDDEEDDPFLPDDDEDDDDVTTLVPGAGGSDD